MDYYIQQAYTIFITLHDIPLDSAAVQRGVQSLQVYCLSRKVYIFFLFRLHRQPKHPLAFLLAELGTR